MDLGFVAGIAGVVLTMAAFCAAATAFPAAVVVSLVSVLLAGFAWWSGSWRTAWTTIYFCLAAVLASPALVQMDRRVGCNRAVRRGGSLDELFRRLESAQASALTGRESAQARDVSRVAGLPQFLRNSRAEKCL